MANGYRYLILAAILFGSITTGAQLFANMGFSLYEISLFRAVFISFILLPVVFIKREYLIKRELIPFFIIYGLIGGLLELTTFGGIAFGVPIAIAALLLYSEPIWTIIFSRLILQEKITFRKVISVITAMIGILLLLESWEIKTHQSIVGILLSLTSGIFLALWVIWGRKSAIRKQHAVTTTFGWTSFSVFWLILLLPVFLNLTSDPHVFKVSFNLPLNHWLYLMIFSLFSGVIPNLLFYSGIKTVDASIAGILLLIEPISASLLAAFLFDQPLGLKMLIGGALILFSNYFVINEAKLTSPSLMS